MSTTSPEVATPERAQTAVAQNRTWYDSIDVAPGVTNAARAAPGTG